MEVLDSSEASTIPPLYAAQLYTILPTAQDDDNPPPNVLQPLYGDPSYIIDIPQENEKETNPVIDAGNSYDSEKGQNTVNGNEARRYKPTDWAKHRVLHLAGYGIDPRTIAFELGIGVNTLYKYFRQELEEGKGFIDSALTSAFMRKALEGDTACLIFAMKARRGWTERTVVIQDDDGGDSSEQQFNTLRSNMRQAQLNKAAQPAPILDRPAPKAIEHKVIDTKQPAPKKY